jgi:isopentenyldiphosphate isomerase
MSEKLQSSTAEELLDIVDEDGFPTGRVLDKKTIHARGLRHRDVHVWVTDGKNLLEQQRTWDKSIMPGAWDISVGGHVAAGEDYLDAAVRETKEELGMDLPRERFKRFGRLPVDMYFEPGPWRHQVVGDHFVVVEHGLQVEDLRLQKSEVLGARLYPINQLEQDLRSPETAARHAPQPPEMWQLGITAMRMAIAQEG